MGLPHVIAIPSPAQGHVIPMLELMQNIATFGFKITFVNTDVTHQRIMSALPEETNVAKIINFVTLPDGIEPWEDSNDLKKSGEALLRVMPRKLEELIEKFNLSEDDEKVTCVIADQTMGWPLEIAEKMQIKRVAFWPAATTTLAFVLSIRKMIDDGIIDDRGSPIGDHIIQLSPTMPKIRTTDLPWACFGDSNRQEAIFQIMLENNTLVEAAERIICNSFYGLEDAAFSLFPNIIPIGPLLASNRLGKSTGHFWREDSSCLKWLDQQAPNSVIYVAFGSLAVFDDAQFNELALGLENTNRPFLWVVRPKVINYDIVDPIYPFGYEERVGARGRIVGWAPQQAVLSHRSVACFLSHCGWNSTLEGISKGVPILCWPYFGDQFLNRKYICDIWKVGLGFVSDEKGLVGREEIRNKVEKLLTEKRFKAKALNLKEMAADCVIEGGRSHNNFRNFIEWMKT